MSPAILIDTGVVLRHLLDDIPDDSQRANVLSANVAPGDMRVYIPATVFLETCCVLSKTKGVPVADAARGLATILDYAGIVTHLTAELNVASQRSGTQGPLSLANCIHLALTRQLGMTRIATFHQKMDRYPGMEHFEP